MKLQEAGGQGRCWQSVYAAAAGPAKPHKTASRLGPAAAAAAAAGPYAGVCAAAEQLFGSIRSTVALQVICSDISQGMGASLLFV